jgi:plastocyanin
MSRTSITSIAVALSLVFIAACGSAYGTGPLYNPDPGTVAATPSLAFTPATLQVAAGDVVTFAFGSVAHNVHFTTAGAPADIGGSQANVSITRTFPTAGTYNYQCTIHPSMTGKVVVQ